MSTAKTLTASEQKFWDVVYKLQALGAVPTKAHVAFDQGRIVKRYGHEFSEHENHQRRMTIQWRTGPHTFDQYKGVPDPKIVLVVTVGASFPKDVHPNTDTMVDRWRVEELEILQQWNWKQTVEQKKVGLAAASSAVSRRFILTDRESIRYLLGLAETNQAHAPFQTWLAD